RTLNCAAHVVSDTMPQRRGTMPLLLPLLALTLLVTGCPKRPATITAAAAPAPTGAAMAPASPVQPAPAAPSTGGGPSPSATSPAPATAAPATAAPATPPRPSEFA